jgi:hypothetical protein
MADITRANLEVLRTPDFQYSGFYFPEIAARLRRFMRAYAPEITNEDLREPFIQLERAFALMGHYNNVLVDMVANDIFLATARHPTSVKYHLGLIDYRMLPASPGLVEVLGKLARTYASAVRILEANRKFATLRNEDEPEIVFENTEAVDFSVRTDQIELAYGVQTENTGVCSTTSLEPDIVTYVSGYQFVTADLNKVMEITGSILNNNVEDLRINELLDETSPGSGVWERARLSNGAFVSETGLSFTIRAPTANGAPDLVAATGFEPWSSAPVAGDKFYFGHSDIMWNRFDMVINTAPLGPEGVWEFYDDSETTVQPDSVVVDPSPGYLRFNLNSLFGIESVKGAHVKIQHVPTGYESKGIVDFSGGNNFVDISGYMGQVTPSDDAGDYLVFAEWRPIDVITETTKTGSSMIAQSGYVKFNIPQTASDRWAKYQLYDIDAGQQRESYFLRYRIVDNSGAALGPDITSLTFTSGDQYVLFEAIQGKTVEDDPLGSSSSEESQEFPLTRTPYILNSIHIYVDEGGGYIEWTEVDSFLTSYSTDRHFRVDVQTDGTAIVIFGDGTNGRIPPIGTNNIAALYRVGGEDDGNIGNGILTINRDGVGVFKQVTNPRAGAFWVEADWASVESLENVKRRGPYNLRTMYRAVTGPDCEILATSFVNTDGIRPVSRARAYEEAFGPKTVEIVVAGQGGAALTSSVRTGLEEYFNGGDTYRGILVLNHEATITNYTPKQIGIEMEVVANSIVTEAMVIQTLSYLLTPTAVESDGVTFVWNFGQEVPLSRIIAEIFRISPGNVFKVDITSPSSDIGMNANELPIFDPINTNVVILSPSY